MGTDRPPPLPARWRPRLTAHSLQAGAEPGLFLPGWLLMAARAARPRRGRAARGDDPDLVRDRLVGGLRAADGARTRATTPTPTRRTPVAGSAFASPCKAWRCSAPATRQQVGRAVEGWFKSDGEHPAVAAPGFGVHRHGGDTRVRQWHQRSR